MEAVQTTEAPKTSGKGSKLAQTVKTIMKEAKEAQYPRSLLIGFSEFDYSQMKLSDAHKLHDAAVCIRGRESRSLIEDGRDFIRIKDLLPHGDWTNWIDREGLCYNVKSVQRAMSVARLCEGRSKHLEGLPATCLYDLAPKSVPDAVKDAVSAEADRLGKTPDTQWVWQQIHAAEAEREAKKSPKAQAAASDAVSLSDIMEADASKHPARANFVALIIDKLSADDARKLATYAEAAGWSDLANRLACALGEEEA